MNTTVAIESGRTHANHLRSGLLSIRARSAKPEMTANRAEPSEVLAIVQQARRETDLSQKAMASDAGISESVLSEALNGRRNFAIEWIWAQDDVFVTRFLELFIAARGLTTESVREAKRQRIAELVGLLFEVA